MHSTGGGFGQNLAEKRNDFLFKYATIIGKLPLKSGLRMSLERAKELLYFNPAYHNKVDELAKRIGLIALANEIPEANEHGANQHEGVDRDKNVKSISEKGGNSSKYRIAKLKRDYPKIAQRLMEGEFKSVSETERAVGMDWPLMSKITLFVKCFLINVHLSCYN